MLGPELAMHTVGGSYVWRPLPTLTTSSKGNGRQMI